MIFFILLIVLILLILYSWISLIIDSRRINLPGPLPLPIVGNGYLFFGDSAKFLNTMLELARTYGKATRFYFSTNRYILLSDPKYLEPLVTSSELITKGKSYEFIHPWLGQGLLTSTGLKWKTHRKFLTPAFHFNILQNFFQIFLKNDKILIEKLKKVANGKDINIFPIIALAALDNVTESIMGVSFNVQQDSESEYVKALDIASTIMTNRMRNPFKALDFIFNLTADKKLQDDALKILHGHAKKVIETRRDELIKKNIVATNESEHGIKSRQAFLDLLLLANINGEKVDDVSIREEVDTFMFEGHDTTTSGISFTLYCLSKHQDMQEKILNEQKDILGDDLARDPEYNELSQMKYLDMVIKESLRLYPPVSMIERLITKDSDLAGLFVPKDTSILIDILCLQRHPDLFENPMEFKPERFEEQFKNPFQWMPFSAGPRNCIGQKFAMVEMKVVLSEIVKNFKIFPSDIEPVLGTDLVLRSRNGVHVKLKPRDKI